MAHYTLRWFQNGEGRIKSFASDQYGAMFAEMENLVDSGIRVSCTIKPVSE